MPTQHLVATVEQIKTHLAQIPEVDNQKRRISTRDAIRSLTEEIRGLQKRGHSLDSIATLLTERGIEIKANTLRMYLRKRSVRRPAVPQVTPQHTVAADVPASRSVPPPPPRAQTNGTRVVAR